MSAGVRGTDDETTAKRSSSLWLDAWSASRVTNDLLHLPDGPALADRDRRVSRVPENFGWIHEFDALRVVSKSGHLASVAEALSKTDRSGALRRSAGDETLKEVDHAARRH